MNAVEQSPPQGTKTNDLARLSNDGRERSFAKVPNLLQYVSNGNYYARTKLDGKVIRRGLETDVFSTARLRLLDFLKGREVEQARSQPPLPFRGARELYEQRLANNPAVKNRSKEYRLLCWAKIQSAWPGIDDRRVNEITSDECRAWAGKLDLSSHYYNNTISTLRQILDLALREHKTRGLQCFENPAAEIARVRVKQKHLILPEPNQFKVLTDEIRTGSSGWGPRIAELVQSAVFLAGSLRASSRLTLHLSAGKQRS